MGLAIEKREVLVVEGDLIILFFSLKKGFLPKGFSTKRFSAKKVCKINFKKGY